MIRNMSGIHTNIATFWTIIQFNSNARRELTNNRLEKRFSNWRVWELAKCRRLPLNRTTDCSFVHVSLTRSWLRLTLFVSSLALLFQPGWAIITISATTDKCILGACFLVGVCLTSIHTNTWTLHNFMFIVPSFSLQRGGQLPYGCLIGTFDYVSGIRKCFNVFFVNFHWIW